MTFNQAVERANEYPSFEKNGITYVYMVVPMLFDDLIKWSNDYMESKGTFNYETAKKYCTNDNYGFVHIVKR